MSLSRPIFRAAFAAAAPVARQRLRADARPVARALFAQCAAPSAAAGQQAVRLFRTSAPALAVQQFKLADIGEGIAEVTLTELFIKEGDMIKEMDNVCSVESDKASVELSSPYTGRVVKIHHNLQDVVKVGSVLIEVDTAGGAGPAPPAPVAASSAPAAAKPATPAAAVGGAVQEFKLADIGEGIAEVALTEWFVKEGDMVNEMDNLCAVESDKASVELTSPFTGKIVKLHHALQDTVKVGSTLVSIETGAAPAAAPASPAAAAAAASPAPAAAPAVQVSVPAGGAPGAAIRAPNVLATPKIRQLAKQHGVNLNNLTGTGRDGRVLESDVLAAAAGGAPSAASVAAPAAVAQPTRPAPVAGEDQVVKITDMVGKGMVKSMNEALKMPTMALGEEIDMTDILKLQKSLKASSESQHGVKVTVTSFMIKAMSLALAEHPKVNSMFGPPDATPNYYTIKGSHNVSIAIDTPNGLLVPNIKDCANLSVIEIQREVLRLAADAKANKLKPSDIGGGTITLSNIGVIGTNDPRPIPFGGQSVIGATGRTMLLPRYNDKMELVPRQIMNIRWVADHRHLDGAAMARFSNSFKKYMENPAEWLLALR